MMVSDTVPAQGENVQAGILNRVHAGGRAYTKSDEVTNLQNKRKSVYWHTLGTLNSVASGVPTRNSWKS